MDTTQTDDRHTVNLSNGSTAKIKRTRQPWVYKSKYDRLLQLLYYAIALATMGWVTAFIMIFTH